MLLSLPTTVGTDFCIEGALADEQKITFQEKLKSELAGFGFPGMNLEFLSGDDQISTFRLTFIRDMDMPDLVGVPFLPPQREVGYTVIESCKSAFKQLLTSDPDRRGYFYFRMGPSFKTVPLGPDGEPV
ncbi:hypothetical protein [Rhizobium sp. MHM7A]|uniref:hypothetical protein n=1 Tax=Rhizobium sp. MHM7A TaxID=2583233 RepID=UPI001105F0E5|nr:hypothetical protein [Rhizobium sp. MHM7A]TLX16081.1 hypothetical protein FFR93_01805 [Rhizobium sp. MHM7A]